MCRVSVFRVCVCGRVTLQRVLRSRMCVSSFEGKAVGERESYRTDKTVVTRFCVERKRDLRGQTYRICMSSEYSIRVLCVQV